METTLVEHKKNGLLDHLKAANDVIDSLGTLLKTGALVVAAVVSLLGYLDKVNWFDIFGSSEIEIDNVYKWSEDRALARLEEKQGFITTVIRSCSSSVGAGEVRQVFQGTEARRIVLVDKSGVTQAGRGLQRGAAVTVQLGNGQSCG